MSCPALHEEPLFSPWLRFKSNLFVVFRAMFSSLRTRILVGLEHSTFQLRGGDVTTSLTLLYLHANLYLIALTSLDYQNR